MLPRFGRITSTVVSPTPALSGVNPPSRLAQPLPTLQPMQIVREANEPSAVAIARHFCFPAQQGKNLSKAGNILSNTPLARLQRKAQLNAAIDQWAQTQESKDASNASQVIKKILNPSFLSLRRKRKKKAHELYLSYHQLTTLPVETAQAKALQKLYLSHNQLTHIPSELGRSQTLQVLNVSYNRMATFPTEMAHVQTLQKLYLSHNQLVSFPAEMGKLQALTLLDLSYNHLATLPAELGQLKHLEILKLTCNQLVDLPRQITQLSNLRSLNLSNNRFTHVPLVLFELSPDTEIDLRNNPLPEAEIRLARAVLAQRSAEARRVPQLLLPALAEDAVEMREAAANEMNVHSAVLVNVFKKRLDHLAQLYPGYLAGDMAQQLAQLAQIATRLTHALDAYANIHAVSEDTMSRARDAAALMFQKSQGQAEANLNEFKYSTGYVLAYSFLALEAQWAATPEASQHEARENGMAALINALQNGANKCDTRLCEEVIQTIGLPLSAYAQAHEEIVGARPAYASTSESISFALPTAKRILKQLRSDYPAMIGNTEIRMWHSAFLTQMGKDHPQLAVDYLEKQANDIESTWETFVELVLEEQAILP